MFNKPPH